MADWINDIARRYRDRLGVRGAATGTSRRFDQQLVSLAKTVDRYQYERDAGEVDKVLSVIPLERLMNNAEEKVKDVQPSDEIGVQEMLIKELLHWFKNDFFTWVNKPNCSHCGSPQVESCGGTDPTREELKYGGNNVELYRCSKCGGYERFPRYNDPAKLVIDWRKGRCGEWANAFTYICFIIGMKVRYIWNSEDHVWTEVYSPTKQRWVHIDSCEASYDEPLLYSQGWGKKMRYVLAIECNGGPVVDVTKRYIRRPQDQLKRDWSSEQELANSISMFNRSRRSAGGTNNDELQREQRELYSFVPSTTSSLPNSRQSGSTEWIQSRGEGGSM